MKGERDARHTLSFLLRFTFLIQFIEYYTLLNNYDFFLPKKIVDLIRRLKKEENESQIKTFHSV